MANYVLFIRIVSKICTGNEMIKFYLRLSEILIYVLPTRGLAVKWVCHR